MGYLASTVVLCTELLKVVASFVLVARECCSVAGAFKIVYNLFNNFSEVLKVCVPALLYTIQNNLMFYSLGKLSMAVQQVTYQLKILTTAMLSVLLLSKRLSMSKWVALVILVIGVSLIQMPNGDAKDEASSKSSSDVASGYPFGIQSDAVLGFLAVLMACFTSGFAAVWLEKLLKQTGLSIWVRNVQLGVIGSVMALFVALSNDGDALVYRGGFFQGYSERVLCTIVNNALGGLLCASVIKYADNILRCFSTALSIVLTCMLSAFFDEFLASGFFVLGTSLAILSVFIYNLELSADFFNNLWPSTHQAKDTKLRQSPLPENCLKIDEFAEPVKRTVIGNVA